MAKVSCRSSRKKIEAVKGYLAEVSPDAVIYTGYDDCIIGIMTRFGCEPVVLYDQQKIIAKLMQDMTREEAEEFFEFNIIGGWVGTGTPAFATMSEAIAEWM